MKRYKSRFREQQLFRLNEWTSYDESLHKQYCKYVIDSNYGERLTEWSIGRDLKDKIDKVKEFAIEMGLKIKDLLKLFMNKYVFKFFQIIGWSFTTLFDMLKTGYKAYQDFQKAIAEYLASQKVVEWTRKELEKLQKFLDKHPKTKKIAGIALASLLVYIWLTMTFTGDALDDFDLSAMFQALAGNYSIVDIFGSPSGVKMLLLFATGALTGLSFLWPGSSSVKLGIAILTTIGKYFKIKISKGKNSDRELAEV